MADESNRADSEPELNGADPVAKLRVAELKRADSDPGLNRADSTSELRVVELHRVDSVPQLNRADSVDESHAGGRVHRADSIPVKLNRSDSVDESHRADFRAELHRADSVLELVPVNHDDDSSDSEEDSDSSESGEESSGNFASDSDEEKEEVATTATTAVVSVRVRPLSDKERLQKQFSCARTENTPLGGRVDINPEADFPADKTKCFAFNNPVFSETATQSEVYEEIVFPLAEAAFKGQFIWKKVFY